MYSFVWPPSLPQLPTTDYSEKGGLNILRTPMDSGPAKQRKRGLKPSELQVTYIMSPTQITTFETFVFTTLNGTARFGITHPRTKLVVEARIIPQSSGDLFSYGYINESRYTVSLQLEILP